jgi:hypothetical protein
VGITYGDRPASGQGRASIAQKGIKEHIFHICPYLMLVTMKRNVKFGLDTSLTVPVWSEENLPLRHI